MASLIPVHAGLAPCLRYEHSPGRIAFFRPGLVRPVLVQNASPGLRPFVHPILAPDGVGELTENEPAHHAWQHGLYVGLNRVNEYGFWMEGRFGDPRDGTFDPEPLAPPLPAPDGGFEWKVETVWRAPASVPLLRETQAWTLSDRGDTLVLDLVWTLRALVDLGFGAHAYGGLFLRMPWREDTQGALLTSEGATAPAAADGRRARWLALSMPIPGRSHGPAGFVFLDHPSNPEHPSPWRVDDQFGVAPSRCVAGDWNLPSGETVAHRFRLVAFAGPVSREFAEDEWRRFAASGPAVP